MKLKVLTTALMATVLSLLITETAQAQGRGYYGRGRNCGNGYNQGYRGGGWSSWNYVPRPVVQVRVNGCGPRGYARYYNRPGCNSGYAGRGGYYGRGGYTTSYSTTTYYNNYGNGGYYGGGYGNGYYNGGGGCGNGGGYRRW